MQSSVVICGHLWSSVVICGHLWSSVLRFLAPRLAADFNANGRE